MEKGRLPTVRDRLAQQHATDSPPAPRLQHCHATDPAVGQDPSRADGFAAGRIDRQQMRGGGVIVVPLQRFRHLLFDDEHRPPDPAQPGMIGRIVPVGASDGDRGGGGHRWIGSAGFIQPDGVVPVEPMERVEEFGAELVAGNLERIGQSLHVGQQASRQRP